MDSLIAPKDTESIMESNFDRSTRKVKNASFMKAHSSNEKIKQNAQGLAFSLTDRKQGKNIRAGRNSSQLHTISVTSGATRLPEPTSSAYQI
jgi:hypothetical protein